MKNKTVLTVIALICSLCLSACSTTTNNPPNQNGNGEDQHITHVYSNYVYNNDATCILDGTETAKCEICDKTNTRKCLEHPATGEHIFNKYDYNNDATCISDGTETAKCETCDKTDTRKCSEYPATGKHVFNKYNYNNDATCVSDGTETAKCETCDETDTRIKSDSITAHKYVDYICSECNAIDGSAPDTDGLEYEPIKSGDDIIAYAVGIRGIRDKAYIKIPSTHLGKPVTKIGTNNDGNTIGSLTNLIGITIPDSVTEIRDNEFENCTNLINIVIPDSVTNFGRDVFANCKNLKEIRLPCTVKRISMGMFEGCINLSSIEIPDSVIEIGPYAFRNCNKLIQNDGGVDYVNKWAISCDSSATSVNLRADTIGIANYAFRNCTQLTNITIPTGVTRINGYVFDGCSSLTNITLPNSITYIESTAFRNCDKLIQNEGGIKYVDKWVVGNSGTVSATALRSDTVGIAVEGLANCRRENLSIPNSVKHINPMAFSFSNLFKNENGVSYVDKWAVGFNTKNPKNITLRGGTVGIMDWAYRSVLGNTNSIESITIPNTVTSIGEGAFQDCIGLKSINIPNSVTNIGEDAFSGCTNLTSITISSSVTNIARGAFSGCTALISVTIPNSVTTIASNAFLNCNSLIHLQIPNSIAIIGYGAFYKCSSLIDITMSNSVTSIDNNAFSRCDNLTKIKFNGIMQEWQAIVKHSDWNEDTAEYIVECNDGSLDKSGNKIQLDD